MKDQIQFETNGLTVLAVKIPEDAINIEVTSHANIPGLLEFYSDENLDQYIDIPEGNWKYHCTTSDMTEEQAKVLVEKMPWGIECYKNYLVEKQFIGQTPMFSFDSLLRSHGIDHNEKRVLLIKEI